MENILSKDLFNFKIKNNMKISSTNNEIYNQLLLYIFFSINKNLIVLTSNLNEATKLYNNIKPYLEDVFIFPEDDFLTKTAIASSPELLLMRLKFLNSLTNNKSKILICHLNSFVKKLPNHNTYLNKKINIKVGDQLNRSEIINSLSDIGYKKDSLVTNTGDYAVRGFVIDVFALDENNPIRIELFGDIVESIKYFDENTQLSLKSLKNFSISPLTDEFKENTISILEYFEDPYVVIQDLKQVKMANKNFVEQLNYYNGNLNNYITFNEKNIKNLIYIDLLENNGNYDKKIIAKENINYNEDFLKFISDISASSNAILYTKNKSLSEKLISKNENIKIVNKYLNKGFKYGDIHYFSDNDLKKMSIKSSDKYLYKFGSRIKSIDKLNIGDYVVHKSNGIGIYMGIKTIAKDLIEKDYVLIKYKGDDKLYLPVEDIDRLYKYSSREGAKPSIHRLNSNEWKKTKLKIKSKIKDITKKLLDIYRKRQVATIEPFKKDDEAQLIFEQEFIYEETIDQRKSTEEIKRDLESGRPMDRLLCGDVGYGKTEVIFRIIFKALMNNKQVMYLCPTTILSHQQYLAAIERFKNYPVNIEVLNRHKTQKEAKEIIERLKKKKIDVIFGTHRLLSSDVEFNDLGLLIIDEEHRFGVEHKEKIKKIKSNVHILSVSATPIPRSLQMSLVGIRDLSLIDTPPKNRYPVQTYVINYDEMLLREVILKEIDRDGQVFILYNKIKNIEALHLKYSKLIPEAKIKFAHGKMNKEEIQDILLEFMNNEFSILISTTIIENGIDIPNANTMIIIDAENFGLSQLYQIRGRVGRSDRIAYAYLMYDKNKILTEAAIKRLEAIKEFTDLGSGYKISMRDLSIRGAGDILGKEQAGFIDSVGVDLYLELVNEEVNNITNEDEKTENHIIIDDVDTHIGKEYSEEDEIIIDLHKKIKSIQSIEDLKILKDEIEDRFGQINEKIEKYMYQTYLEKLLNDINIKVFVNDKIKVTLKINENLIQRLNIEKLFTESISINSKFKFEYKNKYLLISLNKLNLEKHYIYYLIDIIEFIKKEAS